MNPETLAFIFGAVGRWISYLSVASLVGAASFALFIRRALPSEPSDQSASADTTVHRLAFLASLLLLSSTIWRLYAQTYSIFGIDESLSLEHFRIVALDTAWGGGWMWQLIAALLALVSTAVSLRVPRAGRELVVTVALIVVVVVPLTGHATSRDGATWLSVVVQLLHVTGACLWIGTLLVVMLVLRPRGDRVFAAAIRAFSPLAVLAVAMLAVSGLITTIVYIESLSEFWSGAYGRTLVLKLVLFAIVGAIGAYNWRWLKPDLEVPHSVRRLMRTGSLELIVAGLTLAVTAALVAFPLEHE